MKYKKLHKRYLSILLCLTITMQTVFVNMEFPSYASEVASASDSLESELYEDESESDVEDFTLEDSILEDESVIYDDSGQALVPLSQEQMDMLLNESDVNTDPNLLTDSQLYKFSRSRITTTMATLGSFVAVVFLSFFAGLTIDFTTKFFGYFKSYGYSGHTNTFNDTSFKYTNAVGLEVATIITQKMVEDTSRKLEAYERASIVADPGTYRISFTPEDKIVLAYFATLASGGVYTNFSRLNVNVTKPVLGSSHNYPYFLVCATSNISVEVIYLDKIPKGAFYLSSGGITPFYDMDENKLFSNGYIFYNSMDVFTDDRNNKQVKVDYCNYAVYTYALNKLTGFYQNTNSYSEHRVNNNKFQGKSLNNYSVKSLPFNIYTASYGSSVFPIYEATFGVPSLESPMNGASITNVPRIWNVDGFVQSLPNELVIGDEFNLDSSKNLYGVTTVLNPAIGVIGSVDIPTETAPVAPTVSPTVSPSNPSVDTGGITVSLTAILDWLKLNLSPSVFASAVVSALGLSTLFKTLSGPLNNIMTSIEFIEVIGDTVADIANWNIDNWMEDFSFSLSHLFSIGSVLTDILAWDIDIWMDGFADTLKDVLTGTTAISAALTSWTFADWTYSMSQALKDVLVRPLSGLQSASDSMVSSLSNLAEWDIANSLDSFKQALLTALQATFTVFGMSSLIELLTGIRDAVKTITNSSGNSELPDSNTDSDFLSFAKLLYLLLGIIVLLIVIFINCLYFIVSIFSIPASTALLNEDVLKGIDFIKSLRIERFNLSLYDLILVLVYFLLFLTIIKALRRKIDTLRL